MILVPVKSYLVNISTDVLATTMWTVIKMSIINVYFSGIMKISKHFYSPVSAHNDIFLAAKTL